jgi:hypothetical protein
MSSHLRRFSVPFVLLSIVSQAFADVALEPAARPCFLGWFTRKERERPPRPLPGVPQPEHELVIVTDPNATQAELRVPRRLMVANAGAVNPRNAMVGLAISAAFVGGGLWCLRCKVERVPKKTLCVVGGIVLLVMVGMVLNSYVEAKAQMPPQPSVKLFDNVEVTVRVVEQGDEVQLVLPPALAAKFDPR